MPMISIPKPTPMRKMHKAPTWREKHLDFSQIRLNPIEIHTFLKGP
jgi:hypothetical protein